MPKTIIFTAIVPVYNEGTRLINVINALKGAKSVDEIIVVDDGSDRTTKAAITALERVTVCTHVTNMGKTAAISTGVSAARGQFLFMVDADLRGLQSSAIDAMTRAYLRRRPTMLLGVRTAAPWFLRTLGAEIALTGERIIPKQYLEKNKQICDLKGYLFEVAINGLTFGKDTVVKFKLDGLSQMSKWSKYGFPGLWQDFCIHCELIQFLGIGAYLWQMWYSAYRIPYVHE